MSNKRTMTTLALLLAAGMTQVHAGSGEKIAPLPMNLAPSKAHLPVVSHNPKATKGVQAIEQTVLDSLANAFSLYSTDQKPLVWDPGTGRLVLIVRGANEAAVDPVNNLNNLFLLRSDDMGSTWLPRVGPLDGLPDVGDARYPSVMVVPLDGDLSYVYNFPITSGTGWGTMGYGIVLESDLASPVALTSTGIQRGSKLYPWGSGALMTPNADTSTIFVVGTVSAPASDQSGTDNNNLGLRIIDAVNFNVTEVIPDQWVSSKFADPGDANSRTSTVAGVDFADGKVYMGAFGRFVASDDPSTPTVGVSVSEDNGATWSDFDILPEAVKRNYATAQGADPDSVLFTFNTAVDFVTTGSGNFSFITNLIDNRAIPYDQQLHDLVEVYKEGDQWGIRKIARVDLAARVPMQLFANALDEANPDSLSNNQRGNEAQIAKTADGSVLLAKWLDYSGGLIFNGDLPGIGDDDPAGPDTVNTTDVFIAARTLDGTWTAQPINLTNDNFIDKVTWIPSVVPNDLRNIPLLTVQAMTSRPEQLNGQQVLNELRVVSIPQYIMYSTFDASVAVGVEDMPAADNAVLLNNAYPNPTSGVALVQFTTPAAGHATIELYNALGQKVLTVFDGAAHAGVNRATIDAGTLPVGIYYYTLKCNGATETRMLNVVR